MIKNLRSRYPPVYNDIFAASPKGTVPSAYFGLQNSICPSIYRSPLRNNGSSRTSPFVSLTTTATLQNEEDEDTRALRRLLVLRKINAHVDSAYDEMDRANIWLCVVKNVLRDLSARMLSPSSPLLSSSSLAPYPMSSFC